MRTLYLVNPVSGAGRGLRAWHAVERALAERGLTAHYQMTQGRGDATRLAAAACRNGYELVVGVGGDGTLQEIVNGLIGPRGECLTVLGVIPGGTGNDFSKMLGYPQDPVRALDVLLAGHMLCLDLGRANGRYYINIAGVGFDAEVAAFLNRRPKRLPAVATYVYGVLVMLFGYRPALLRLVMDTETLEQKCLLVSVCNGHSHAGGMKMCPEAKPDDGMLDICVAGDLSRLETLFLLPKVFSGRHTAHPKVKLYKTRRIKIDSAQPLYVQADGEIFGQVPAEAEVVPKILRVVAAAGSTGGAAGPPAGLR